MSRAGTVNLGGALEREKKIYMAYKVAVAARKREQPSSPTAEILAMIHTAKAFKISVFTMLDIAKRRGKTTASTADKA